MTHSMHEEPTASNAFTWGDDASAQLSYDEAREVFFIDTHGVSGEERTRLAEFLRKRIGRDMAARDEADDIRSTRFSRYHHLDVEVPEGMTQPLALRLRTTRPFGDGVVAVEKPEFILPLIARQLSEAQEYLQQHPEKSVSEMLETGIRQSWVSLLPQSEATATAKPNKPRNANRYGS